MTDERSNITDDAWVDTLTGKNSEGDEDARLIRATLEAHAEHTAVAIDDEALDAAKQKLLARLESNETADKDSTVIELSTRRPSTKRSFWSPQNPGMLLAASVAFVAIIVMVLNNPDVPAGPQTIMSYGEIDIVRGTREENIHAVEDPDAYGRELGSTLVEREIPFVLLTVEPDSPDRIISIQVDGVGNVTGAQEILEELGVRDPRSSVVTVRLVPEQ